MNNTDGGAGGHLRQREGGREAERERERERVFIFQPLFPRLILHFYTPARAAER